MLVLTLQAGDVVHIGEDIQIKVVHSSKRGRYSIGFEAPPDVKILRDCLRSKIESEGLAHEGPGESA
jgi:carbon storage regulator CsrA